MSDDIWRELADELIEHGIPERRAEVVALVANGRTHAQVADELNLSNRSAVAVHLDRYRNEDLPHARWVAENAPEV